MRRFSIGKPHETVTKKGDPMRIGRICGSIVALSVVLAGGAAEGQAKSRAPSTVSVQANVRAVKAGMAKAGMVRAGTVRAGTAKGAMASQRAGRTPVGLRGGRGYVASYSGGGISCVPFARENSGIELSGNAYQWWDNAEGLYQRGNRPEVGSVLNFRSNGRMRLGHVAVVSNVIDGRNVEIDHANWAGPGASRGRVSRNINVVDVSPGNDWSAVRVALGQSDTFGSIYPTYGFIYDRPDRGTMLANAGTAPALALNPAPSDLRPSRERFQLQDVEEVAEAADEVRPRMRAKARVRQVVAARRGHAVKAPVVRVKAGAVVAQKKHSRRM